MGLLIGGWCDMFGMDSTTSYKLSNSLSLSSMAFVNWPMLSFSICFGINNVSSSNVTFKFTRHF
jgi:hypothetical protein